MPYVKNVSINSSKNTFTDTAEIVIQNRLPARGKRISDIIKQGAEVKIELGYYPNLKTEFTGYAFTALSEKPA